MLGFFSNFSKFLIEWVKTKYVVGVLDVWGEWEELKHSTNLTPKEAEFALQTNALELSS